MFFASCELKQGLVIWSRLGDPFLFEIQGNFIYISFSKKDPGLCMYHLSVKGQISVFCTISSGSASLSSHVYSCISSFTLCISRDKLFYLCHHIGKKIASFALTLILNTHSVMVIVVGNGHCNTSSNPGQGCLHFT